MTAPIFANASETLGSAPAGQLPEALEREIRRIYDRSPLYGSRFPLHAEPLQWGCYREIPTLSKKEIVQRGHQAFFADYGEVERGLQTKRYEYESTGGTTQAPMTVIMEDGWWNAQTRRAYLASPILRQFVDRPYRKCVLAPVGCSSNLCPYEDHPFPHRYFDGTVYLNLSSDPFAFPEAEWDRIVLELQATKPEVLEGEPVYLSLLARAAKKRGVTVPSLKAVILTYGKASAQHGARIAEVFPAPQVDLYGSTEAGYLFVGEAFKDNSQVIDANAFIELVPWPAPTNGSSHVRLSNVFQIYVTTRDREAMPLLRYHTGDIVQRFPTGFRLLGREGNLHFRRDGSLVSPTDIDAALPADFSCWHYSLVQTSENRWDFHYVADAVAPAELEPAVAAVLGAGVRVSAFRRRVIAPAASGKFSLLKPLAK
ncbi:coenzyme F390 synthetase [Opitutus terrae]|uniref:Coenzyme F390 synthetase-like protein n=1 Tax=Opitutus terrae (strain DSM 11246 / JCM 15787 / PB90-1) TaxID=452637 RepID=B1ZTL6_OPITP|nr:coenzyme F390 synthetase [Opitutus terrae]ACB73961.1 Coenzyme F390 synthetase-like protein [Opitutus terrae PB90-1]